MHYRSGIHSSGLLFSATYFLSGEFVVIVAFDAHSHHTGFIDYLLDDLAIFSNNLPYKGKMHIKIMPTQN